MELKLMIDRINRTKEEKKKRETTVVIGDTQKVLRFIRSFVWFVDMSSTKATIEKRKKKKREKKRNSRRVCDVRILFVAVDGEVILQNEERKEKREEKNPSVSERMNGIH